MSISLEPDPSHIFSLFSRLTSIGSESMCEKELSGFISSYFSEMGLSAVEDNAGEKTGGRCGNLFVTVPGRNCGLSPIIICSHMDTVMPGNNVVPVETEDRFTSSGETILGADDKAGVAATLAAVKTLMDSEIEFRPLQLIFTVQEEIGLVGSKNLDYRKVKGKWGIVLDGEGDVGGIVVKAPSQDSVKFTVHGRSAHAGVEPEKGINAITCAAKAIAGVEVGRIDESTTSNIGIIDGGRAINIVPDLVVVEGEVRSFDNEKLKRTVRAMEGAFRKAADDSGCELESRVERSFSGFDLDPESGPVRYIHRAIENCGYTTRYLTSGGGSDTNVFNRMGLQMVTGSIGLGNPHSKDEFIMKDQLVAIARVLVSLATISVEEAEAS
ncbi:MAG: M20/M25/M40 family metallo-hydrolase [Actinobacteria bacterium]|nr:M20/M25/M40 family metallo-hydrolase [Actinomycetota bacterium]